MTEAVSHILALVSLVPRISVEGRDIPPTSPHPIRSLQSGPMKAKYLILLVTKNSEYLKGCRNGLKIAFAFCADEHTLIGFGPPLSCRVKRAKINSQAPSHHVLRQMRTMHWTCFGVARDPLHRN